MCVCGFWRNICSIWNWAGNGKCDKQTDRQTDTDMTHWLNARGSKAKRTTQNIWKDLQFNSIQFNAQDHPSPHHLVTPINHHSATATATYTSKVRVFHSNRNSNSSISHRSLDLTWFDLLLRCPPWRTVNEWIQKPNESIRRSGAPLVTPTNSKLQTPSTPDCIEPIAISISKSIAITAIWWDSCRQQF